MVGERAPKQEVDADFAFVRWGQDVAWREPSLAALFFFVVAYVAFGANVFGGEVVAPMDVLSRFSGYTENSTPLPLVNVEMGDVLDSVLPSFRYVKRELLGGHLPLWNPLSGGGEPSLPLVFNGFITPRFLLFLLLPDWLGYTLGLIVQAGLGGLGAYALCRLGMGILPALLAGITFMLSGFNSAWAQWPHVSTCIWIPWTLWALGRLDGRVSRRNSAVLAGAVALLLFGGFPSVAGYGFYFAGALGAVIFVSRFRRLGARPALTFAGAAMLAVGLGLALTAIQLLPSLHYLRQFDFSARDHATGLPPETWRALIDPKAVKAQWTERTAYVGILPLILTTCVLLAARLGPVRRMPSVLSPATWLGLLAFALAATYSTPAPVASLLYRLPILNFNPSGRMSSVVGLAFAVLSGIGAESLLALARDWLRGRLSARLARAIPGVALAVLLLVQAFDEGATMGRHNAHASKAWFYPLGPTVRFVRDQLGPDETVLATTDAYMLPGTLGSYGIPEWFGHAFRRNGEKRVLEKLVMDPWAPGTSARVPFDHIALDEPLLDRLGVRFVLLANAENPLDRMRRAAASQPRADTPVALEEEGEELGVGQTFVVEESTTACSVQLKFGTHRAAHASADVRLMLTGPDGISAEVQLPADAITDNNWVDFVLPSLALPRGEYSLRVGPVGVLPARLAIWSSRFDSSYPGGTRLAGNSRAAGDLAFRLLSCDADPAAGWRLARQHDSLLVLENTETTNGVFLMARNASPAAAPLAGSVRLLAHAGSKRRYEVTTAEAALLIRAARFWPGFRATVDGSPVDVSPYETLFQAVAVPPGTHVVDISYVPVYGGIGALLSGLAAVAAAVLILPKREPRDLAPRPRR